MKAFKQFAKFGMFIAPAGGLAYFASERYFRNTHHVHSYAETEVPTYFKNYTEENNLVSSSLYKNYQMKYKFDHFFEKGVLKGLDGVTGYNLLLNKSYNDVVSEITRFSGEERRKMHEEAKIHCTFVPTEKVQGYDGLVHGGFTSTLYDNVAGCLAFMACDFTPAVTAYLNVNYNKPMTVGTEYVAVIEVEKMEGRKVFLKGKIVDKDNNVYTTMETLYVKMKFNNYYIKHLCRSVLTDRSTIPASESASRLH